MFAVVAALTLLPPALLPPPPAGKIAWLRDYDRALAQADERGAPLLVFFRGQTCDVRSTPYTPDQGRRDNATTDLNDCDLMQKEVWENGTVAEAITRFLPVLVEGGDQKLNVRYQVVINPTTLITDPWGNEIFRVTHYLEHAKMTRLLQAIPGDFRELEPFGRALRQDANDLQALMGAAAFYQGQRLPQVSERLYEKAGATTPAAADLSVRRQVAIARGLNLLLMGRDKDAAGVFDKALGEAPGGAGADALLLGLVNAHLQGGRRKEAETALKTLEKGWPGSPYAARARQNFDQRPAK